MSKQKKLEDLTVKYPEVFRTVWMNGEEHPFMAFSCGDGWFDILEKFARKARPLVLKQTEHKCYITTIKEKYGTLNIYLANATEEIWKAVEEAEAASETTCETCGARGRLRGKSWYYTACYEHTKEKDR